MNEHQVLQLLKAIGVMRVFQDEQERRLKLEIQQGTSGETVSIMQYKAKSVGVLRELEESRQEILENRFATPMTADVPLGPGRAVRMQVLKRDDQLSEEEREEKRGKLLAVTREIARHKSVMAGLNYLQVHFQELDGRVNARPVSEKTIWYRGVKSAALHCLNESRKVGNEEVPLLDLCRHFLARFAIEGEEQYTAEQLLNNIRQICLLDRLD